MHFDVLRITTIRKLSPDRRPRANYTGKSQEIGLTKRICDIIPVDNWIRGYSQLCGLQDIFLQIISKRNVKLFCSSPWKKATDFYRFFRGSECSTGKQANVFRKLPSQQVALLLDPWDCGQLRLDKVTCIMVCYLVCFKGRECSFLKMSFTILRKVSIWNHISAFFLFDAW